MAGKRNSRPGKPASAKAEASDALNARLAAGGKNRRAPDVSRVMEAHIEAKAKKRRASEKPAFFGTDAAQRRKIVNDLETTARALVASGKGILAADESTPTITKRFKAIELQCTEETRRSYREMLFTTPSLGDDISGVILFDETIRQKANDGTPFVELLRQQGIIPGIKVDKGAKALARFTEEKVTEGLDGLRERLDEYRTLGARFTKWRAVIRIGDGLPTRACRATNAHALARFAAQSQESGLVPIVEPEVLMDGDHAIWRCEEVTGAMLRLVFGELAGHRVALEQMLLKVNMVLAGEDCPEQASVLKVAEATLRCMRHTVPAAVPGILFLSGGQDDVLATQHLNIMNQIDNAPWQLSFSYGRALQAAALKA